MNHNNNYSRTAGVLLCPIFVSKLSDIMKLYSYNVTVIALAEKGFGNERRKEAGTMRKVNKYAKDKKGTETYVKLSDVHREFGEWCKLNSEELRDISDIDIKYFHYFVNLLPSVELDESRFIEVE